LVDFFQIIESRKRSDSMDSVRLLDRKREVRQGMEIWTVVAAAGKGDRFGSATPKQFVPLGGQTLLERTLSSLKNSGQIHGLCVVVPESAKHWNDKSISNLIVCPGGPDRSRSVRLGVDALPSSCDMVLVHDAVRPAVNPALIQRIIQATQRHGACVPVMPVTETIKRLDSHGNILATEDRRQLFLAQTPQGFMRTVLTRAYEWLDLQAKKVLYTDDAALVADSGQRVATIAGATENRKVTVPEDLAAMGLWTPRVGFGYDVHRLVAGRPLMLAGLHVPYAKGLMGHSDGDAALHALCDAMLGAAALGDIGRMFPDSDPGLAGTSSLKLLKKVKARVAALGFGLASVDLTIVAQKPKLARYIPEMVNVMAEALDLDEKLVGLKATTEEGLGVSGQAQAVAAYAVCVLHTNPLISVHRKDR
jgi:2-C-methyl-D-erythritol 4-phosphate cytidylyltransferase/2-C-methyl-D-erythritol 2,4-cyclodiphosphate synthase